MLIFFYVTTVVVLTRLPVGGWVVDSSELRLLSFLIWALFLLRLSTNFIVVVAICIFILYRDVEFMGIMVYVSLVFVSVRFLFSLGKKDELNK